MVSKYMLTSIHKLVSVPSGHVALAWLLVRLARGGEIGSKVFHKHSGFFIPFLFDNRTKEAGHYHLHNTSTVRVGAGVRHISKECNGLGATIAFSRGYTIWADQGC